MRLIVIATLQRGVCGLTYPDGSCHREPLFWVGDLLEDVGDDLNRCGVMNQRKGFFSLSIHRGNPPVEEFGWLIEQGSISLLFAAAVCFPLLQEAFYNQPSQLCHYWRHGECFRGVPWLNIQQFRAGCASFVSLVVGRSAQ